MNKTLQCALVATGLSLAAVELAAQVKLRTDVTLRQYCSNADDSALPRASKLKHFVLVEDFAAHDAVRLQLAYSPDIADPEGRGTISARVKLLRADGTRRKLGKLSAVQNRVSGDTAAVRLLDEPLNPGDVLVWSLNFKNFGTLDEGICFVASGGVSPPSETCGPYSNQETSEYILPYNPGDTSVISQGNCTHGSHKNLFRYAYDFALPMDTEILAVRAGNVVDVEDFHPDGTFQGQDDNHLDIEHDDGSHSRYVHITQNGAGSIADFRKRSTSTATRSSRYATAPERHSSARFG